MNSSGMNLQQAMKDPMAAFASPEALETLIGMAASQKHAILVQWQDQLRKLLIADEESMLRVDGKSGGSADCLRRVTDVLTRLPGSVP